jgi:hypothetical protein
MKEQTSPVIPHRSWFFPHTCRNVDKQGVAVDLAFLVVVAMLAGGAGEKTDEQKEMQGKPDQSTQVEIRPLHRGSLESGTTAPAHPITGVKQELEDPRQGKERP